MKHLALDPQQLAKIDFDTFDFPELELVTRSSGEELLMVVWAGGRRFLLHDREIPRDQMGVIEEVRAEVEAFNADTITGWRDLVTAAVERERQAIADARDALFDRTLAVERAHQDAGFACLRARSSARTAV